MLETVTTRAGLASTPRRVHPGEREGVVRWLDDGLRGGRRGRLEAEYPTSMAESAGASHRVVFEQGRPLSHAMLHVATVEARGRSLAVGLIGNVYTEPDARGRGLAGRCIEACLRDARRRGLPLALLWSEREAFYERLGFHECGVESYLALDAARARLAVERSVLPLEELEVTGAEASDLRAMERLYRAHPVHVRREPGALARLVAAPDSRTVVARRAGRTVAYASLGRGDDFQGVVHEWAGEPGGVLRCVEEFVREDDPVLMLAGPAGGKVVESLRSVGAPEQAVAFARAHLLDAAALWRSVGCVQVEVTHEGRCVRFHGARAARNGGSQWHCEVGEAEALSCFFGAPQGSALAPLVEAAPEPLASALRAQLPWPLYLWGFDSI